MEVSNFFRQGNERQRNNLLRERERENKAPGPFPVREPTPMRRYTPLRRQISDDFLKQLKNALRRFVLHL